MAVPPPNVKVYDRPEKKGPSPIVLAIVVLVVAIVGFFVYKAMHHDAPTPTENARPGIIMMSSVMRTGANSRWQGHPSLSVLCVS